MASAELEAERARRRRAEEKAARVIEVARQISLATGGPVALLQRVSDAVVAQLGGSCAVGLLDARDPEVGHVVALSTPRSDYEALLRETHARRTIRVGEGMIGQAVALRRTIAVDDLPAAAVAAGAKPEHLALIARFGIRSQVAVPLLDAEGEALGALVAFRLDAEPAYTAEEVAHLQSIAELAGLAVRNARLQEAIEARNGELQYLVDELRSFSYSFAHDLRAPLRAIAGLSEILVEDHGEAMGEDGVMLALRVVERASQATGLVDQLLGLARVSVRRLALETVDLSALAERIVTELREGERARSVQVEIEGNLQARVDAKLARTVLLNLLQNAWKYTAGRPDVRIRLYADGLLEGLPAFGVSDNGIGFDVSAAGRIFEPFQRLHEGQLPGHGVGLASVQRAVRRHGGTIEAHGVAGEGARFRFSLPPP